MNIKFKFNLGDKVAMKYSERFEKTFLIVSSRIYKEEITGIKEILYECLSGIHIQKIINEKLLEKYKDKNN